MKRQSIRLIRSFLVISMLAALLNGFSSATVTANNPSRILSDPSSNVVEDPIDMGQAKLLSSSTEAVSFEIEIPWQKIKLSPINVDGKDYTKVSLEGWAESTQAGSPELPILVKQVGVPFGENLEISVLPGKTHTYQLDYPVLPVVTQEVDWQLGAAETDVPSATNSFAYKANAGIYQGNVSYPARQAEITSDGILRQQRIASVTIYPTQYQPASQRLVVYESLQVTIKFIGNAITSKQSLPEESMEIEKYLQANLMNYKQSKQMRVSDLELLEQHDLTQEILELPWTPPSPGWRVKVRTDGLYKLSYSELQTAGLPVDTLNPLTFQMFSAGQEVAIKVIGESDGNFGGDDYILFYGESIDSKYTQEKVYWLTFGLTNGLRMATRSGIPGTAPTPEFYKTKTRWEENKTYYSNFPNSDDMEHFLWGFAYTGGSSTIPWTYGFNLPSDYTGTVTLRIKMLGYTTFAVNPDHHISVFINETNLGEAWWDGQTWNLLEIVMPQGVLKAGTNTIRVTSVLDTGATYDLVYIDWFELDYSTTFTVQNNALVFSYTEPGIWKYLLTGFTADQVSVLDVSNPTAVVEITGTSILPAGSGYSLEFEDEVIDPTNYIATEPIAYKSVQVIEADIPSNLRSAANGADHITITHASFSTAANTLKDHRASQGLRAVAVDVQDIYDEFNYGIVSPTAIHDFLLYSYQNWQAPAPTYVVLLGDGHYDPKDYLNYHRTSFIPPYLTDVDPWMGETSADNRYVTIVGTDTLPDMMLGRISVNTLAEANTFVKKIITYETTPVPGDWAINVLAVADNADTAGNFPLLSDNVISCCLPENYPVQRIYYGTPPYTDAATTRAAILSAISSGKMLVNYIGHGYTDGWAGESLFYANLVPNLANGGMLPVVLAMTCSEGYHINPHTYDKNKEALGEVVTRADAKGAIASWSPTGQGVASGHDLLNRGFLNALFWDGVSTIGEAILAGKLNLGGASPDLLDTYMLFGDPALVIIRPVRAEGDNYTVEEDQILAISAPGVLGNDTTSNPGPMTAVLFEGPTYGTLILNADGSFTYDPNGNFNGIDHFSYKASVGGLLSNTAAVEISVLPINDAPFIAGVPDQTIAEGEAFTTIALDEYVSDIDNPDTELIWSFKGNVELSVNIVDRIATITMPSSDWNGSETITFRATDPGGLWDEDPATFTVTAVNDAPVVSDIPDQTITEGQSFAIINLDDYVSDVDNADNELIWSYTGNTELIVTIVDRTAMVSAPNGEWIGSETITFRATDPGGLWDEDAATFTVTENIRTIFLPMILR